MVFAEFNTTKTTNPAPVGFTIRSLSQVRNNSWLGRLLLLDCFILLFANPRVLEFLYDALRETGYLASNPLPGNYWIYWMAIVIAISALAVFQLASSGAQYDSPASLPVQHTAIKGEQTFRGHDAELFAELGRTEETRSLLTTLCNSRFRFGILSGDRGCGKSSIIRAGIMPRLKDRKHQAIYIEIGTSQPTDAIRTAIHEQFAIPMPTLEPMEFAPMLELASRKLEANCKTMLLILDGFERFFINHPYSADRKNFVDDLCAWYNQKPHHPVKLLLSTRSGWLGRMVELQNALGYRLGPKQNFRLEKFEANQAAKVLQSVFENETIDFNLDFIKSIRIGGLIDPRDGMVSPLDLQRFAWMIARRATAEKQRFDQVAFQRRGFLEKWVNRVFDRGTQPMPQDGQQSAIQALTMIVAAQREDDPGLENAIKLPTEPSESLSPKLLNQSLDWLDNPLVRLVTAPLKGEEPGVGWSLLPLWSPLRSLRQRILNPVTPASRDLSLGLRQKTTRTRAEPDRQSEAQLQQSILPNTGFRENSERSSGLGANHRRNWVAVAATVVAVLAGLGYALSFLPPIQMWQAKQALVELNNQPAKPVMQQRSAVALAIYGAWEQSIAVASRIGPAKAKAATIQKLATLLGHEDGPDAAVKLLHKLRIAADAIQPAQPDSETIRQLTGIAAELRDPEEVQVALGKLQQVQKINGTVNYRADTYQTLARTAVRLKDLDQAVELFDKVQEASQENETAFYRTEALKVLSGGLAKLNDPDRALNLLNRISADVKGIENTQHKKKILATLARTALHLKDPEQASATINQLRAITRNTDETQNQTAKLHDRAKKAMEQANPGKVSIVLGKAQKAVEDMKDNLYKVQAFESLAKSAAELNEPDKIGMLLDKAQQTAVTISDPIEKSEALQLLGKSALDLQQPERAKGLRETLITAVASIEDTQYLKASFRALTEGAVNLEDPDQGSKILGQLHQAADTINDGEQKAQILRLLVEVVSESSLSMDRSGWLESVGRSTAAIATADARNNAWLAISKQSANLGNWTKAKEFADRISAPQDKILALSHLLEIWGRRQSEES